MKKFFLWLTFLAAAALTGAESNITSSAHWIWYPEKIVESTRILKSPVFRVKKPLRSAKLYVYADDSLQQMWLNGKQLPISSMRDQSIENWRNNPVYDVKDVLADGSNVLAFVVHNGGGPGGVIARIEITPLSGKVQNIVTNGKWFAAKEFKPEEIMPGAKGGNFVAALDQGDFQLAPWNKLFMELYAFQKLLTDEEFAAFQAARRAKAEQAKAQLDRLNREPLLPCKIDFSKGRPQFVIGDQHHEVFFFIGSYPWQFNQPGMQREIKNFAQAGMHLYGMGAELTQLWQPDGTVKSEPVIQDILKTLRLDPEAHILLGISCSYPQSWWKETHPDELIDYANGGVDYKTNAPLKNYNACSMASEVWRKDFSEAVGKLVAQLEASPIGKRIFAYRVDYGVYREWHYYGMQAGMPDTGKAMTKAFRAYLMKKYPTDAALQKAWNDPGVTRAAAVVPGKVMRETYSAGGMLRDPVKERAVIDYLDCMGDEVYKCLEAVDSAVKKASHNRVPVGNYCGYFWGMGFPAEGWHLKLDKLLDAPFIDFFSYPSTYGYQSRNLGAPGEVRALTNSFRLHGKLALQEADTRTNKTPKEFGNVHCDTAEQAVGLLSRDFVQSLSRNTGMWYMDFCKFWYDDPALLDLMQRLVAIRKIDADRSSASEVVLIGDLESVPYHAVSSEELFMRYALNRNYREAAFSGAPFDMMLFSDLPRAKKEYKVYVFVNLFYVTPEKQKVIDALKAKGKTLVWNFVPGYLTPHGANVQSMEAVTGMKFQLVPNGKIAITTLNDGTVMDSWTGDGIEPFFAVSDPAAKTLGTSEVGGKKYVSFAEKIEGKAHNYYTASGYMDRAAWRAILKESGVHLYSANPKDVIYANKSFVALHAGEAGAKHVDLPRKAKKITMLLPEKREMPAGKSIDFSAKIIGETALFLVE